MGILDSLTTTQKLIGVGVLGAGGLYVMSRGSGGGGDPVALTLKSDRDNPALANRAMGGGPPRESALSAVIGDVLTNNQNNAEKQRQKLLKQQAITQTRIGKQGQATRETVRREGRHGRGVTRNQGDFTRTVSRSQGDYTRTQGRALARGEDQQGRLAARAKAIGRAKDRFKEQKKRNLERARSGNDRPSDAGGARPGRKKGKRGPWQTQ